MGALIDAFPQAMALVFDPYTLGVGLLATIFGLFVGAMPGLTATMAVALLIPVTFFIPPVPALVAIVMSTSMAIFAGDIPDALLRIPGTPASAAYADDAYLLTKQGKGELAIGMLPGAGTDIAAWISYSVGKKFSKIQKNLVRVRLKGWSMRVRQTIPLSRVRGCLPSCLASPVTA